MKKFAILLTIPATPELEKLLAAQATINLDIDTSGDKTHVEIADLDLNAVASGAAETQFTLYDDDIATISQLDYDVLYRAEQATEVEKLIDASIRRQRRTGEPTLRKLCNGDVIVCKPKKKGERSKDRYAEGIRNKEPRTKNKD